MKKLVYYSMAIFALLSIQANAQCASSNSVSTNNLVLDMPFTNGLGNDISGNNLNATTVLTGTVASRLGFPAQAISLPGNFNAGGTVAHSPLLDFTNQITLAAWIKVNNLSGVKRIVDKISASTTGNFLLDINGATLRFFVASGSVQQVGGFAPNTWFHVAATYNGTTTCLYLNGVLTASTAAVSGNLVTNTSPMKIGLDQFGANPFAGSMDDLKIYGRALSSTEVLDLYQEPVFIVQPPASVNLCSNQTYITAQAISTGTVAAYKWKKGGVYITNNSNYAGATTNTLTIINGGVSETGTYEVEAFSPNCISALSQSVAVTTASITNLSSTGLILNYPYNNLSGKDISGNNFNANISGNYLTGADEKGTANSAIVFSNAVSITPHNALMNVTNQLSLSCWINPSLLSASALDAFRLIDKFNGTTSGNFVLDISQHRVRFFCGSTSAVSTSTLNINTWYHVAATYDGTNIKIYINGNLDQTVPFSGNLTSNTSSFIIGKSQVNTSEFYGSISDVKFYSRAISAQEIADMISASDVVVAPATQTLCAGQTAVFVSHHSGSDLIWKKNGVPLVDGANISGSTTRTLTIANVGATDFDVYTCESFLNCIKSIAAPFSLSQRNQVTVLNDNLIFYYAFNNTVNTDYSGNVLNIQNSNGISSVADKDNNLNKALSFNGSGSYALLPSSPLMYSNGNAATFSMWLKPASSSGQRIIEKNGSYYVDINANVYRFILNTGNVMNTTVTPIINTWQHITFTYDGTNMKFFLNGVLTNTLAAGSFSISQNTNAVYIGSNNFSSLNYSGSMDEIRFYKRALTDQEVYGLYSGSSIQQQIVSSLSCNSGSALLNATAFGNEPVSYQWYLNGTMLSGQTTPTLSIPSLNSSNTGAYVCTYSNLCSVNMTDTAIIQLLAPSTVSIAINPTVSCSGMPVTLTASSPSVSSYVWSVPSGTVNFSSVFTPTMGTPGTYSYSLTTTSGTCTVQNVTTLTVSACTGIHEDLAADAVSIYPNPINSVVYIDLSRLSNASLIEITNALGETVMITEAKNELMQFDLSQITNGIYFVKITNGNTQTVSKIIKH